MRALVLLPWLLLAACPQPPVDDDDDATATPTPEPTPDPVRAGWVGCAAVQGPGTVVTGDGATVTATTCLGPDRPGQITATDGRFRAITVPGAGLFP